MFVIGGENGNVQAKISRKCPARLGVDQAASRSELSILSAERIVSIYRSNVKRNLKF